MATLATIDYWLASAFAALVILAWALYITYKIIYFLKSNDWQFSLRHLLLLMFLTSLLLAVHYYINH
jgi:hypothetical protein